MKNNIKDIGVGEVGRAVAEAGFPRYRADQILGWIYGRLATSFDDMKNLPLAIRTEFSSRYNVDSIAIGEVLNGKDGTVKTVYRLHDGDAVESVLIPDGARRTLCVSTQAGCAMGCRFCLTGGGGFRRNLSPAEIIDQVIFAMRQLRPDGKLSNIVFMGMGEPLKNFDNFKTALETITDEKGLAISPARLTFSTVGLPAMLRKAADEFPPAGLAVSLNAPDDDLRKTIMPVSGKHTIEEILKAAVFYAGKTGAELTFEYVLLGGINDSAAHARQLAGLLSGIHCKVNLIQFNPFRGSQFRRPADERAEAFQAELKRRGVVVFVRSSRGGDIGAACGQLGSGTVSGKASGRGKIHAN